MRAIYLILLLAIASQDVRADKHIVPFTMRQGLIMIKVDIDGQYGNFIFDSGASDILVNGAVSDQAKTIFETLNGPVVAEERQAQNIEVAGYHIKKSTTYHSDLSALENYLGIRLLGIFGSEAFTPDNIIIDHSTGHLIISDNKLDKAAYKDYKALDFEINDGVLLCEVRIQGQRMTFLLDSGATSHFISSDSLSSLRYALSQQKSTITANGQHSVKQSILVDETNLSDQAEVFIVQDFDSLSDALSLEISGILSLNSLSQEQIIIDLDHQQVHF